MIGTYQYRPVRFFLAAYLATWIPWLAAAYAVSRQGLEPYGALLTFAGLAGPCAAALVLTLTSGNAALKSDLKDRLINLSRIRPGFLAIAIVLPFAIMVMSIWLSLSLGQSSDQLQLSGAPNSMAMVILALVLAPLLEEMGWRGYGVDSLRARFGMTMATLLFGVLWCLWHAPLMLISGTYQNQVAMTGNPIFIANFFVSIIPAGIITNWLYYKNNRSIPAAVVLHSMLNAAAVLLNAGQVAKCIATVLYAAAAVAVIAVDRGLFAEGPRSFLCHDGRSELETDG